MGYSGETGTVGFADVTIERHLSLPCLTTCPVGEGLVGTCSFGEVVDDLFRPECIACVAGKLIKEQ